jgi:hypothetical protein
MTTDETAELIALLQKHTALSRIGYGELETALLFAASNGYVIAKSEPAAE